MMYQPKDDRSLGELFAELANEVSTLMRQEVTLARTEMTQKASQVGRNVASLAIGGAVAFAGFLAILAAVIIGLAAAGLPWWLSALLVGVVVAGIGYYLIRRGMDALNRESLAPEHTIESLKEDREWAKDQMK